MFPALNQSPDKASILSPHEREELYNALKRVCLRPADLKTILYLSSDLHDAMTFVVPEKLVPESILDVLVWAEAHDLVGVLVASAYRQYPSNIVLKKLDHRRSSSTRKFFADPIGSLAPLLTIPPDLMGRIGYGLIIAGSILLGIALAFSVPLQDILRAVAVVWGLGVLVFFLSYRVEKMTAADVVIRAALALILISGVISLVLGYVVFDIVQLFGRRRYG